MSSNSVSFLGGGIFVVDMMKVREMGQYRLNRVYMQGFVVALFNFVFCGELLL